MKNLIKIHYPETTVLEDRTGQDTHPDSCPAASFQIQFVGERRSLIIISINIIIIIIVLIIYSGAKLN